MNQEILNQIRNTPIIFHYLREHSEEYRYLYRNPNYIKTIEKKAKEFYQERPIDKIEKLKNQMNWIQTILSVIE